MRNCEVLNPAVGAGSDTQGVQERCSTQRLSVPATTDWCARSTSPARGRRCVCTGGAAVTEEFAPGFRNSTASYTVSLLQPKVIADMGLARRGYRVIERPFANFLPLPGDHLLVGGGLAATQAEFA